VPFAVTLSDNAKSAVTPTGCGGQGSGRNCPKASVIGTVAAACYRRQIQATRAMADTMNAETVRLPRAPRGFRLRWGPHTIEGRPSRCCPVLAAALHRGRPLRAIQHRAGSRRQEDRRDQTRTARLRFFRWPTSASSAGPVHSGSAAHRGADRSPQGLSARKGCLIQPGGAHPMVAPQTKVCHHGCQTTGECPCALERRPSYR